MSINQEIQRISQAKVDIKEAIEEKGVTVGDGTLDTYPEKIAEISGGGGIPDKQLEQKITEADFTYQQANGSPIIVNKASGTDKLVDLEIATSMSSGEHGLPYCPKINGEVDCSAYQNGVATGYIKVDNATLNFSVPAWNSWTAKLSTQTKLATNKSPRGFLTLDWDNAWTDGVRRTFIVENTYTSPKQTWTRAAVLWFVPCHFAFSGFAQYTNDTAGSGYYWQAMNTDNDTTLWLNPYNISVGTEITGTWRCWTPNNGMSAQQFAEQLIGGIAGTTNQGNFLVSPNTSAEMKAKFATAPCWIWACAAINESLFLDDPHQLDALRARLEDTTVHPFGCPVHAETHNVGATSWQESETDPYTMVSEADWTNAKNYLANNSLNSVTITTTSNCRVGIKATSAATRYLHEFVDNIRVGTIELTDDMSWETTSHSGIYGTDDNTDLSKYDKLSGYSR